VADETSGHDIVVVWGLGGLSLLIKVAGTIERDARRFDPSRLDARCPTIDCIGWFGCGERDLRPGGSLSCRSGISDSTRRGFAVRLTWR
jgi:hypothetical protein